MKLTKLEEDLAIHQKLDDEPNDVGGLTAQEMKKTFDQAGLVIQDYLNGVHLPQVEAALGETLEEAKAYADRKVVVLGAGDMAAAVYDEKKRRRDVYDYADEAAAKALGGAARFGYVAAGRCESSARQGEECSVELGERVDPRGLWNGETGEFVVPAGAEAMLLTAQVKWAREAFSMGQIIPVVNGVETGAVTGPGDATGKYVRESVLLPLAVQGGDRVKLRLRATGSNGNLAEVGVTSLRAEIIL